MSEPKKNTRWKCFHKQLEDISKAPAQAESLRFNWRKDDDEWNERRSVRPEAECNKLFTVITKISNGKYAREKFEKKEFYERKIMYFYTPRVTSVVWWERRRFAVYLYKLLWRRQNENIERCLRFWVCFWLQFFHFTLVWESGDRVDSKRTTTTMMTM